MGEPLKTLRLLSILFVIHLACGCSHGPHVEQSATPPPPVTSSQASAPASPRPSREEGQQPSFTSTVKFNGGQRFTEKVFEETNAKYKYEINVVYPQLEPAKDARVVAFNRVVAASVRKEVDNFRGWFRGPQEKRTPSFEDVYDSLDARYEVIYATDELVSIRFTTHSYGWGAAHSVQSFRTLNYDLKANKTLRLSDLFKSNSKHLKFIADFCVSDLRRQNKADCRRYAGDGRDCERENDFWLPEYVTPTARNYQNWNLANSGLLLSFDACRVASCAAGEREVLIPYAALDNLLSADSIVASMAKGVDK